MMEAAMTLAFIALLLGAAVSDLLTMKIPNWLSLVLGLLFFPAAFVAGMHITAIGLSAVAALCVFIACFGLFALNVMGGGDAKLLTACALWFGLSQGLIVFLVNVAFCGGLVTLLVLLIRWKSRLVTDRGFWLPPSLSSAKKIPYGLAIAAGGLLSLPQLFISM